jgi:site-specific recombinase XerD
LNKAITGFLNFKTAEGMADRTIDSYDKTLNRWLAYTGEVAVPKITSQKISQYLIWLRTD